MHVDILITVVLTFKFYFDFIRQVFFSVLMGAFNIGQSASYFEAFATGKGAAATIFQIIDRIPEIDSYSESGKVLKGRAQGKIQFKDVDFCYPSRPDIQVTRSI